MQNTKINTQIVANPHKGNSLCVAISGVDTPELVDSYTLSEMMDLVDQMDQAIAELRAAQILNPDSPTLFDMA